MRQEVWDLIEDVDGEVIIVEAIESLRKL